MSSSRGFDEKYLYIYVKQLPFFPFWPTLCTSEPYCCLVPMLTDLEPKAPILSILTYLGINLNLQYHEKNVVCVF